MSENRQTDIQNKAKYIGREYYPMSHNYSSGVFAVRYFDANMDEVGYYIPDTGGWYEFITPRKWSKENLQQISCQVF
jgi:hypothetical protein